MRHFFPVDLNAVKTLAMGWVSFAPSAPADASILFYLHLCFVFVLIAWLPWSKLMHMAGIFPEPHAQPDQQQPRRASYQPLERSVKLHSYEEYEEEFGIK